MGSGLISDEQALMMLEKVRRDSALPGALRTRIQRRLGASVVAYPARALQKIQEVAASELPDFQRAVPVVALSRVVQAASFWKYMVRPDVRDVFLTAEDFTRFVDTSESPASVLREFLSNDPILFPWERSWLAESSRLRGLDGHALTRALELTTVPPFVVFEMSREALVREGVTVRQPCSLDSVLGPNPQWRPGGPASGVREYVDGDLPRSALTGIRWVR